MAFFSEKYSFYTNALNKKLEEFATKELEALEKKIIVITDIINKYKNNEKKTIEDVKDNVESVKDMFSKEELTSYRELLKCHSLDLNRRKNKGSVWSSVKQSELRASRKRFL